MEENLSKLLGLKFKLGFYWRYSLLDYAKVLFTYNLFKK